MARSESSKGGLISAIIGLLALIFQLSSPAPTINFSTQDDVYQPEEAPSKPLALSHQAVARTKSPARERVRQYADAPIRGKYVDIRG